MIDVLEFIFRDPITWLGTALLLLAIRPVTITINRHDD